MAEPLWRAAIEEIRGWNVPITIQPWGLGESLLHPQFFDVMAFIKSSPHVAVGLYTNGMQWDDAAVRAAVDLELDWICVSIDGMRRDVFEHYRVGASFDKVVGTAHALAAERRRRGKSKPELRVNMVAYAELADHADEFVAYWRNVVDYVTVGTFRPTGSRRFSRIDMPRIPCYQLETIMVMGADGRVVQCCEDPQGRGIVGWFPRESLAEIWRGANLNALRQAHREGRYTASALCADCDGWTGVYAQTSERGDLQITERTVGSMFEYPRVAGDR
jgi:MoaA/NifB/PqqE/SkfB family radical SAM enzyme